MKKIYLFAIFIISFNAFSQEKTPPAVDEYAQMLKKISTDKSVKIEAIYHKGMEAINALSDPLAYNENEINAKWLKELRTKLQGFNLDPNTETTVASPNLEFFKNLSKKHGAPADVAFFELEMAMKPSNGFPVYIHQETDYSGCTEFDGSLTKYYQEWTHFKQSFPQSFPREVKSNIDDIENHLLKTECFCEKKQEPILKELRDFLKKYPKSSIRAQLEKRIKDIESKKGVLSKCRY